MTSEEIIEEIKWLQKSPDIEFYEGILKGYTEMLAAVEQEIDRTYEKNKANERDALNEMPVKVAIQLQSGFLLGYANAIIKFRKELKQKLSEIKEALR